jgi:hypothetical protein
MNLFSATTMPTSVFLGNATTWKTAPSLQTYWSSNCISDHEPANKFAAIRERPMGTALVALRTNSLRAASDPPELPAKALVNHKREQVIEHIKAKVMAWTKWNTNYHPASINDGDENMAHAVARLPERDVLAKLNN